MARTRIPRLARLRPLAPAALVGLLAGIVLWGAFNTALEATNGMDFCVSCHEMRSTVYEEYRTTVHYRNPSGVRATCSDCHVPKDWTHKVVRKVQATAELWGKLAGSIDTREKFEARRLDLARHEWARMRASDSRECRNCHGYDAMDFHAQRPRSAEAMRKAASDGRTCIDCHKGIAHRLPDMTARHRALHGAILARAAAETPSPGDRVVAATSVPFRLERGGGAGAPADGEIAPLTEVAVTERDGELIRVDLAGWQREGSPEILYTRRGRRIPAATLEADAVAAAVPRRSVVDPATEQTWTEARLSVWVPAGRFSKDAAGLATYGAELYESSCAFCHALPAPASIGANDWIGALNDMKRFVVDLRGDEVRLLQKYLQERAKDAAAPD